MLLHPQCMREGRHQSYIVQGWTSQRPLAILSDERCGRNIARRSAAAAVASKHRSRYGAEGAPASPWKIPPFPFGDGHYLSSIISGSTANSHFPYLRLASHRIASHRMSMMHTRRISSVNTRIFNLDLPLIPDYPIISNSSRNYPFHLLLR